MSVFVTEYRIIGYGISQAFNRDPKCGRKTFFVRSEDIGTEDIQALVEAARSKECTPEGYTLFMVRNVKTGEVVNL